MGADASTDTKKPAGKEGQGKEAPAAGKAAPDKAGAETKGSAQQAGGSSQRFDRMAVRAKLAVSEPGDAVEREADHVAAQVMRAPAPETEKGGHGGAAKGGGTTKPAASPPKAAQAPGAQVKESAGKSSAAPANKTAGGAPGAKGATSGEKEAAVGHAGGGEKADHHGDAQAGKPKAPPAVQQRDGGADTDKKPTVPADFAKQLGEGRPLDAQTRGFFEQRLGKDLSHVRVHTDSQADAACVQIHARAFTFGNHIAFAAGQFQPQSEAGKSLIAHELAHVLQQSNDTVPRTIMRNAAGGAGAAGSVFEVTKTPLKIPPIKSRHTAAYKKLASAKQLKRPLGYDASTRGTAQRSKWTEGVTPDLTKLKNQPNASSGWSGVVAKPDGTDVQAKDKADLLTQLRIPAWNASGKPTNFQVDHMVEYQLGGADELFNMELLNQEHNGSVGSSFAHAIRGTVRDEIDADPKKSSIAGLPKKPTAKEVMDTMAVVFTLVEGRETNSKRNEKDSHFWSQQQIVNLEQVLPVNMGGKTGSPTEFVLLSPTGSLVIGRFKQSGSTITMNAGQAGGIAGFRMKEVQLQPAYNDRQSGEDIGSIAGEFDFGKKVQVPQGAAHIKLTKDGNFAGKLGADLLDGAPAQGSVDGMSPFEIADLKLGKAVSARATIHPTHPALASLQLPGEIRNGKLGLFYTVDATSLAQRLKIPGLTIDDASITLGFDGTELSVGGGAEFTIRNFGTGNLEAMVDSAGNFELEGGFRADTRLFDQAALRLWYRSKGGFGGEGTLAITTPNKIRGIRSARVSAKYDQGVFKADGTVQPDLPGVESAGLAVTYGPDASGATSLRISGDLSLKPGSPGIRDGSVHVEVEQVNDAWRVKADGKARPNLPGIESAIVISYDDGTFDGTLDAAFSRGILSGTVKVGVTNRPVNAEGEVASGGASPAGAGSSQEPLKIYGGGTLVAKLTEKVQGGVGVKVKPSGKMLVSGRIGIPGSVELFGQYPAPPNDKRELFHMPTISVPLVGFAVGGNVVGIALTITGGVDGYAHVGPGMLTQAEVKIDDFDPALPESLHIQGGATFDLPAAAGVEAKLNAGVSLGAAVIRATAALGVSAAAGVEAHVTPHVDLDWRPSTGLHVHGDLTASLTPKLKFALKGSAEVVADAFVTTFTLWRKEWTLAEKEIGTNLSLGINVPVDYYSDGRGVVFDPSKVTFQVPSLDKTTFTQLLNSEGSEQVQKPDQRPAS